MTANAGRIRARLELNNEDYKRKMNETREEMKRTSFSADQMSKDFDRIQRASAVMGAAIVATVGSSVKVAADFESSLSKVEAVSGATSEEMQKLEKAAREAGASTVFSAKYINWPVA